MMILLSGCPGNNGSDNIAMFLNNNSQSSISFREHWVFAHLQLEQDLDLLEQSLQRVALESSRSIVSPRIFSTASLGDNSSRVSEGMDDIDRSSRAQVTTGLRFLKLFFNILV